jgi:hypothetical protein
MKKSELIKLIQALQDDDEVDETISKSELGKALLASGLTLDAFKAKLNDPAFKAFMDSEKDTHFNKALETWKKNNLQALVDAKYKKQHPEADPANEELRKIQKELEDMKAEKLRTELKNIGIKYATEKKLPVDLVDYFIGADETATKANIDNLAKIFEAHDKTVKEELLKQNSYTPPAGGGGGKDSIAQKLLEQNKGTNSDLGTARESYFK